MSHMPNTGNLSSHGHVSQQYLGQFVYQRPQQLPIMIHSKSIRDTINPNLNSSLGNNNKHSMNHEVKKQKPQTSFHLTNNSQIQFHPSYFLLSKFPQLTPKDQIYLPLINRLQTYDKKHCFHQLYVNLKFLLVQSQTQFWKYLSHLHYMAMNGMSDDQVREGYKLRLALESCLMNFPIKEFNKCVSTEQIKSSSSTIFKRIYQYQNIFNSSSFKLYDKLFQTVIEFFQRLVKTRNPLQINIITNSWYMDTLKIMQLATIYGNKQPQRVKQLIKQMFLINPKVYTRDFGLFIKQLHRYIDNYNQGLQAISLLECLSKKVQAVPNKHKYRGSNFHNPEKYFGRELLFICSDCLKLFIYVTNVFKFFPSKIKLIFMQNIDFLRVLIKISIRVIYNLRVQHKKRWKMSQKLRSLMKDMQFALLQKITQMYKFIFVNTKNALEQQLFDRKEDEQQQRTVEEIKQQRIILRFYKKLIEGTVNRKKDIEKDKNITSFLSRQYDNSEQHATQSVGQYQQTHAKPKGDSYQNSQLQSQHAEQQQQQSKQKSEKQQSSQQHSTINNNHHNKSQPQQTKQEKNKKQVIQQSSYGRVLIKHLLRKQLKKDNKKYTQLPYFYTKRLYDYFSNKYRHSNSKVGSKRKQYQGSSEEKSIEMMKRGFMKYLLVLEEFQSEVRKEYVQQVQFNNKYSRLDMTMRQLPSLQEFRIMQQHQELHQLIKSLTFTSPQCDKQYNDQPTQQQQLQLVQWTQRVLDEDDFTRISQTNLDNGENVVIQFDMKSSKGDSRVEEWAVVGRKGDGCDRYRGRDGKRGRCFQGESEGELLSPEEITEQQLASQQPTIVSTSMMMLHKMPNSNNNTTTQVIDPNISKYLPSSSYTIFKPHQSLKKLSQSMIKQQLQYFNKIKGLNWHQISRISVNNNNNRKKDKMNNTSYDQVLERFDKMIKVEDIGLSFDMVLGEDSDYDDENGGGNEMTASNNFSYFYYNQWKHESTKHKKKSFMQDYEWSQSHLSNNNQTLHQNHQDAGKTKKDNNEQLQNKQLRFNKKTTNKSKQHQITSKINTCEQSSYQYRGVDSCMAEKQLLSIDNNQSKEQNGQNWYRHKYQQPQMPPTNNNNEQCYVRRDYANYVSNNNISDYKYNTGTNGNYNPLKSNNNQYPNYRR